MTKHLTRQPVPDVDIRTALEWVKGLVDTVLADAPVKVEDIPELTGPLNLEPMNLTSVE